MKSLLIDTSKRLMVSFIENEKILFIYDGDADTSLSEKVMPLIDEGFKKCNWCVNELDNIFVTNGPGSFTGIRVGLTIAKVFGFSLEIPVIPLSSLELMASGYDSEVYSLIVDRNGFVYIGGYDGALNNVFPDQYISFDNVDKSKNFVSYDVLDVNANKPKMDLIKVINKHKNDPVLNVHSLKPNYLKMTDAEKSLKND